MSAKAKAKAAAAAKKETDDTILLEDGFSVVDSLKSEGKTDTPAKKGNGKADEPEVNDDIDANIEGVVSDSEDKKAEAAKPEPKKTPVRAKPGPKSKTKVAAKAKPTPVKKEPEPQPVEEKAEEESSTQKSEDSSKISEATLIISNDEDITIDNDGKADDAEEEEEEQADNKSVCESTDSKKQDVSSPATKQPTPKPKSTEASFIWVSNISRLVKASGLKRHFSGCGKVNTAKVVTNGKLYFGYVVFESAEIAAKCVRKMNNTVLGGKKIIVTRTRPDINRKDGKASEPKKDVKSQSNSKKPIEAPNSEKSEKPKPKEEEKPKEKSRSKDDKQSETKKKDDYDRRRVENQLIKDIDRLRTETKNLRRRLINEQMKTKNDRYRAEKMEREINLLKSKLRAAERNYSAELAKLSRKNRAEQDRLAEERSLVLKQKEDVRRRQEELEREFKRLDDSKKLFERQKRVRKSRSPSPHMNKRFRGKDSGYPDHRSPPPPPKLSADSRGKHIPDRYYEEKKPRNPYDSMGGPPSYVDKPSYSKDVNGRHRSAYQVEVKSTVVGPQRPPWNQVPQSDSWKRSSGGNAGGGNIPPGAFPKPMLDRYQSSSSYQVPQMSYYPPGGNSDYSKHGHYDRKY